MKHNYTYETNSSAVGGLVRAIPLSFTVVNGTVYGYDTFSFTTPSYTAVETTGDRGGCVIKVDDGPSVSSGNSYRLKFSATGTSSSSVSMRSVKGVSGSGTHGSVNYGTVPLDGVEYTWGFTCTDPVNDEYIQIGFSLGTTCNYIFTITEFVRLP